MSGYYFDHAATTPMHPEVLEAMIAVMQDGPANASSIHQYGRKAKQRLNQSRDLIAKHLGCKPNEFIFTSGGTESDNLAIFGAARVQAQLNRKHLITSAIEHHAVLHAMEWLQKNEGFELTVLPVDEYGFISLEALQNELRPDTALVSIMHANNEVGSIQPIYQIGNMVHEAGALLHVDAVQTLGHITYNLQEMPIDFASFSAHKIYGPQGIGGLYVAPKVSVESLIHGGKQERKRRAGTENIAAIVGFAKALDISVNNRHIQQPYLEALRNRWVKLLSQALGPDQMVINGDLSRSLPHIVNISFLGFDTETLLMNFDMSGIAVSSGSACTSGSLERSHVLQAMRISHERLNSAVRFSFGMGNTMDELEAAAEIVVSILQRLRS